MDYAEIRRCLANGRFTDHARREMDAEPLGSIRVEEIMQALDSGEIIEEYPEDKPYPSCLILGRTITGRPLHTVCAPALPEERLIIITTYQPDPNRWEPDFRRRKR
ncbi:MAG: DUF4258 domain-containing protein [Deltaproteobacteria bacterium]|nr:DUF4258 domain-containing protein [Deltaproteobacteria bacterium]